MSRDDVARSRLGGPLTSASLGAKPAVPPEIRSPTNGSALWRSQRWVPLTGLTHEPQEGGQQNCVEQTRGSSSMHGDVSGYRQRYGIGAESQIRVLDRTVVADITK